MKILVVDFETRWDSKEYTLSKLTTEEYIRSPRFKAFGIGVKEFGSAEPAVWITHDDIQAWVDSVDWSDTGVLAHNAQFDVAILAWVYGARPKLILDSLSMGRALRGVEVGNSLATLAEHYGLPAKGKAVNSTNGLAEISYEIEQELADYCLHDVFLCEQVFNRLNNEVDGGFPKGELRLIDLTLKMFCYPTLELDEEMLHEAIAEEKEKREALLAKIGIEEVALASNDKFADVLLSLGVTPPTKISKTTGKEAYALAKNDALFQALLNSDNEDVSLLC
jgi:DNA polymerase